MLQCDPTKRCSFDVSDGRKKFCGKHSTEDSRGGRTQCSENCCKPKRKLPRSIAEPAPPPAAPSPTSVTDGLFDDKELMQAVRESMESEAERREKKARLEADIAAAWREAAEEERREEAARRETAAREAAAVAAARREAEEEARRAAAVAAARYVIIACSYPGAGRLRDDGLRDDGLPAAASEAKDTAAALPTGRVTSLDNPDADQIRTVLNGKRAVAGIHLIVHGDAPLSGEFVPLLPLLSSDGRTTGFQAQSIAWWVALITGLVAKGLRYVYLGGCCTDRLGSALHRAGVPVVVCFESKCETFAVKIFGTAFAQAINTGITPAEAYVAAHVKVLGETELGVLDDGTASQVQKYEFVAPDDWARVHRCFRATCGRGTAVVGKCPWAGRLSPTSHAQGDRDGWKGRVAAGVPKLLV